MTSQEMHLWSSPRSKFLRGNLQRNQAHLSSIAKFDGHFGCALLTEPEMFDGIGLAANGGNDVPVGHRASSTSFSEVNTEQSSPAEVSEKVRDNMSSDTWIPWINLAGTGFQL